MLNPVRLRTEYKQNPIGMDEKCPRFSYELNGNSKYQTAYRILVEDEQGSQMWASSPISSMVLISGRHSALQDDRKR